ncbi:hypothetical protein DSM104443_02027 [Usitatibacter rugosus]|uniref:Ig-like domain-containing protein n=1 Tax=Usitatibacter rugosus TaxID=2732067 RepID=A0A6M4GZJ1_9PROT|nr:hypothetical protein [Usitatibacter rugosus]QJR10957.1 hypothetical protein DSM104443_02027 [Usitatibacter rugosus]
MLRRAAASLALAFALVPVSSSQAALPMRVEASVAAPDGGILLAGQSVPSGSPLSITIAKRNADGTADTAFFGGGSTQYSAMQATAEFRVTAIAVQPDGKLLVATVLDGRVALVRFNDTGTPDYSFGISGPGLAIDDSSDGHRVNALVVQADGTIFALGSYNGPETGGAWRSMVARYYSYGFRDAGFSSGPAGAWLAASGLGDSEIRAAVRTSNGFVGVGYARQPGADKNFLFMGFQSYGTPDMGFGQGGAAVVNAFGGHDDEAFAVTLDTFGSIVAAGRDGHGYGTQSMSNFLYVRMTPYGTPDYSWPLYHSMTRMGIFYDREFSDVTTTSVAVVPGSGDLILGGTVVRPSTGASYFGMTRFYGGWGGMDFNPLVEELGGDDLLKAAYPNASGQVIAVGTREEAGVESARIARYFADKFDFDTDFAVSGADAEPNPLAFRPVFGRFGPSAQWQTDPVRIGGINVAVPVTIENGTYSIGCTFDYVATPGTANNGDMICVRAIAAATPFTTQGTTVHVGSTQGTLTLITGGIADTTLLSYPANPSGTNVQFGWGHDWDVSGYGATFECSLDGAPFAPCAGGNYNGLANGPHTFQVRAVNEWGTEPTPATHAWSVAAPPETTILSTPPVPTNQTTATFTFSSNDPTATFECRLFSTAFAPCTSPVTFSGLFGSDRFYVRAVNAFGVDQTPAEYAWFIDTNAPSSSIVNKPPNPSGSASATFTFTKNDSGAVFQCSLDGEPFTPCSTPKSYTGLPEGTHTFRVRAVDAAGNIEAFPPSYTWVYDVSPPDTTLTGPWQGHGTTATFQFASSEPGSGSVQCSLDGEAWRPCWDVFTTIGSTTVSSLSQGTHTFSARAVDGLGHIDPTPASITWVVDTIGPDVTITSGPVESSTTSQASATFTFTSTESGATFACLLGDGFFTPCTSPVTYPALSDGSYTFRVQAVDLYGNATPYPYASRHWTVDTVPPETFILSHPSDTTASQAPTFTFSASEPATAFECKLDAESGYTPCTSPKTYASLAEGAHQFSVRARDGAGQPDPTPPSFSWTVDLTSPDTLIVSGPAPASIFPAATFVFSANEPGSTFQCRLDGAAFAACTSPATYSSLADGAHTFQVRAFDGAGNPDGSPSSFAWTIDTVAADTAIVSGPSGATTQVSATFTFSSPEGGVTFECRLDGAAFAACTSPRVLSALSDGSHTFDVRAKDSAGNVDPTPASRTWTVDTTAPGTGITSFPPAASNSTSASFSFSASETATFQCKLDGASFAACTSPKSYSGLSQASHTFQVRATDSLGNVDATPASYSWIVDTSAPNTTINSGPSGTVTSTTATFTFSSSQTPSNFECQLDSAAYAPCTSPKTYTGVAVGNRTFRVRAIDAAGNVDASPATRSWRIN